MSNQMLTPPSTLSGIKNLAKRIKVELKIPHTRALNVAAQQAGYENFNHARNTIDQEPTPLKMIYLTSYWRERDGNESGRITIGVPSSRPVGDYLKPHQVRFSSRYIGGFKLEFTDHLEAVHDASEDSVLENLGAAARTIQFMERTGLRPASRGFPKDIGGMFKGLPGLDHMSWWMEPGNPEKWVVLNEPYSHQDMEAWAKKNGIYAAKAWGLGLYRAGQATTTIFTQSESYSKELLLTMSEIASNDDNVVRADGAYNSEFISPARATARKTRKPRPMPEISGVVKGNVISYGGLAGESTKWRPLGSLSLSDHLIIGPILEALWAIGVPYKAVGALLSAKLDLVNWLYREHPTEISDDLDFAYNGNGQDSQTHKVIQTLTDGEAKVNSLNTVITVLSTGYPSCPPLNAVIKRLIFVADHISKHAGSPE